MYEAKIPGHRYVCTLENVKGQWMVRIKLGGVVESETVVKDLSDRGIRDNIKTVVRNVELQIPDILMEQLTKDITTQAKILISESSSFSSGKPTIVPETNSALEERIKKLEDLGKVVTKVEELEEKVAKLGHLERVITKVEELEEKVAKLEHLEKVIAKVEELEEKVAKLQPKEEVEQQKEEVEQQKEEVEN